MKNNKYVGKNGRLNEAGIKRMKEYITETEKQLRERSKYNGPQFDISKIKLLKCGFDELNLTNTILYVPSYAMFQDVESGKQYTVDDAGITEHIPSADEE